MPSVRAGSSALKLTPKTHTAQLPPGWFGCPVVNSRLESKHQRDDHWSARGVAFQQPARVGPDERRGVGKRGQPHPSVGCDAEHRPHEGIREEHASGDPPSPQPCDNRDALGTFPAFRPLVVELERVWCASRDPATRRRKQKPGPPRQRHPTPARLWRRRAEHAVERVREHPMPLLVVEPLQHAALDGGKKAIGSDI